MEIYKQITFLWSKFHHHENDMKLLMKFYTINHSHYHSLSKWLVNSYRPIGSLNCCEKYACHLVFIFSCLNQTHSSTSLMYLTTYTCHPNSKLCKIIITPLSLFYVHLIIKSWYAKLWITALFSILLTSL